MVPGMLCSCSHPISRISDLVGAEPEFGVQHLPAIVDVLVCVCIYEETHDNCNLVRGLWLVFLYFASTALTVIARFS